MKAHELLEKFLNFSFRVKLGLILIISAALCFAEVMIYRAGVRAGDLQSEVRYTEREKEFQRKNAEYAADADTAIKSAAAHLENEKKLSAENFLLKQQQILQAQISTERDDRLRQQKTEKLQKLISEKENKLNEITDEDDFDNSLCGLCHDFAGSGSKLSDELCGRCPPDPR